MEAHMFEILKYLWPISFVVVIVGSFKCFKHAKEKKGIAILSIVLLLIGAVGVPAIFGFVAGFSGKSLNWVLQLLSILFYAGAIATSGYLILNVKTKNPFIIKEGG